MSARFPALERIIMMLLHSFDCPKSQYFRAINKVSDMLKTSKLFPHAHLNTLIGIKTTVTDEIRSSHDMCYKF